MRRTKTWDRLVSRLVTSCREGARKKYDRRRLFFEPLEGRRLLAADLELTGAAFQNSANPYDVNADGSLAPSDAVIIANEIAYADGDYSTGFPDINGDSEVTATDMELVIEAVTEAMAGAASVSTSASASASTSGTCIDLHVDPVATIPEGSVFTISGRVDNYDDCQADSIGISRLDIDEWNYGDFGTFAAETFFQEEGIYEFDVAAIDSASSGYPTDSEVVTVTVTNVAPQLSVSLTDADGQPIGGTVNEGDTVWVEVTIVDPGVLDDQTIEIDWGVGLGGASITREAPDPGETPWLDFWNPVEPQAGPLTITEVFTHTYIDDDPTGSPSDDYTITVTVTDDDGDTDSEATSLTVNNVAPTLGLGTPPPIIEGEKFDVSGVVIDPGLEDTHVVTLKADLNFNGSFSFNEIFVKTLGAGQTAKPFTFFGIGPANDDGPSPGNGTAFDNLNIVVEVTDDDGGAGGLSSPVLVNNVAPVFTKDFSVDVNYDAQGVPANATITGAFSDPGNGDVHTGLVTWGDGQTTPLVIAAFGREFTATRTLAPSAVASGLDLFPVQVSLRDDDTGEAQKTQTAANACLVKSLDVISNGATTNLADQMTIDTGVEYVGANVTAGYLARGEGNINNCTFERTVIDHAWYTENGQRKDLANTNGQETPDGPLTTPQNPNAGVGESGILAQGNAWSYYDQDAPGFAVPITDAPAGKKATYTFRIRDKQGTVMASASWTLDLTMTPDGGVSVLPGVGQFPRPPVKIS